MRPAAEAMVESFFVVDREAGGLFLMERAAGLKLAPGLGELHRRGDDCREGRAGAEFVEPGGGESQKPLPPAGGVGEGLFASACSIVVTTPSIFSNISLFQNRMTR